MTEVVIGLDPHKASNTIAVLDRDETILTQALVRQHQRRHGRHGRRRGWVR